MLFPACTLMPPENERLRLPQIENAVLPMARAALEAGQFETAWRLYRRLLEIDPGSVDARTGLGDIALARKAPSEAANWYLAAAGHARNRPQRHAALLAHGRAALAAGDLDAARASFGRLADPAENASDADAAWGFNGIGIVSLLQGRPRQATAAMEQAVLRLPEEQRFHGNLARALKLARDYRPPDPPATASTTSGENGTAELDPIDMASPASGHETPRSDRAGRPEQTIRGSPRSDGAEPGPSPPRSTVPEGDDPAVPAPDPAGAPDEPVDATSPDKPTAAPEMLAAAVAQVSPAPETPDTEKARPLRRPPDPAGHNTADGTATSAAGRAATAQATTPRPSFPDAFLVRLEAGDFLQVGAFASQENARKSRSRLLDLAKLPVRIDPSAGTGRRVYRVRIGPVPSHEALSDLVSTLGVDRTRWDIPDDQREDDSPSHEATGPVPAPAPKTRERSPARNRETPIHVVENGAGFVQVGAYANHDSALAVASKLRGMTEHPVTLSELARGDDPTLYRVRIGPVDADARPELLQLIASR